MTVWPLVRSADVDAIDEPPRRVRTPDIPGFMILMRSRVAGKSGEAGFGRDEGEREQPAVGKMSAQ